MHGNHYVRNEHIKDINIEYIISSHNYNITGNGLDNNIKYMDLSYSLKKKDKDLKNFDLKY